MTYYLGVDLGTTYTAAATWRDGQVEIASLGNRAPVIPSVLLIRQDGEVLVGEAAARRSTIEPHRVAREFKRRIGDPTPIMVGDSPWSADALTAKLLRWVVDKVSETEGGPPRGIAVAHPANWGHYKKDLLDQALALADVDGVVTVTEPEAAAIHYATQGRVSPGDVIAVYDLGGGTFDAAVLRKTETGWDILGDPEGIERLGGIDFDEAVFRHVQSATGTAMEDLDPDDPATLAAMTRLRQECVEAKEALSSDVDASIPVLLPTLQTEVRLTRAEFEAMIRPPLADSITAMERALRSAGVAPEDVMAVLLVGGSSRVPLVAQLVGSELKRPVAVDAHPKYGIALGAAIVAAQRDVVDAVATSEIRAATEEATPASGAGAAGLGLAGAAGVGVAAAVAGTAASAGAGVVEPPETLVGPDGGPVPGPEAAVAAGEGAAAATLVDAGAGAGGADPPDTVPEEFAAVGDQPTQLLDTTDPMTPVPPPVPPAPVVPTEVPLGEEPPGPGAPSSRFPLWLAVGVIVAAIVVLIVVAVARAGDDEPPEVPSTVPSTTSTPSTAPTTVSAPAGTAAPPVTRPPQTTTTTAPTTTSETTTTTTATTTSDTSGTTATDPSTTLPGE